MNPLIGFQLILMKAFAASDAVAEAELREGGMQSPRQLFEA
ncbi:MAG TPA: hypothetical protein VMM15_14590 [Bradyrhizobium sp.]|nr:hypothetical protein [Bradyrhizobium sp.]